MLNYKPMEKIRAVIDTDVRKVRLVVSSAIKDMSVKLVKYNRIDRRIFFTFKMFVYSSTMLAAVCGMDSMIRAEGVEPEKKPQEVYYVKDNIMDRVMDLSEADEQRMREEADEKARLEEQGNRIRIVWDDSSTKEKQDAIVELVEVEDVVELAEAETEEAGAASEGTSKKKKKKAEEDIEVIALSADTLELDDAFGKPLGLVVRWFGDEYEEAGLSASQADELESLSYKVASIDEDYVGESIDLDQRTREIVEYLVHGEAGNQGFAGKCLVAQCLRDTMLHNETTDIMKIIKLYKYSGSITKGTDDESVEAVKFIFDKGGYAVKHRVVYFYAPKIVKSAWHETQNFVIEWKGHRFFDNTQWK